MQVAQTCGLGLSVFGGGKLGLMFWTLLNDCTGGRAIVSISLDEESRVPWKALKGPGESGLLRTPSMYTSSIIRISTNGVAGYTSVNR